MKRVKVLFKGEHDDLKVKAKIEELYLKNPFGVMYGARWWVAFFNKFPKFVKSVVDCTDLSLLAKNPTTGQWVTFNDKEAKEWLASSYYAGHPFWKKPQYISSKFNLARARYLSFKWRYSWKYWYRNHMYVPVDKIQF